MRVPKIPGFSKKSVLAYMKTQLSMRPSWSMRGCVRIYEKQTKRERRSDVAHGHNGVGFNKLDTPRLSVLARKINNNTSLTDKEINLLCKRMPRYAGQLISIADLNKLQTLLKNYYSKKD